MHGTGVYSQEPPTTNLTNIISICKLAKIIVLFFVSASADLQLASNLSRRLLVVLSPQLFENQWTPTVICPLIRQLCEIHANIICVPLKVS